MKFKNKRTKSRRPASEATGAGQVAATHKIEAGQLEGEATRANRRAQRKATSEAASAVYQKRATATRSQA